MNAKLSISSDIKPSVWIKNNVIFRTIITEIND